MYVIVRVYDARNVYIYLYIYCKYNSGLYGLCWIILYMLYIIYIYIQTWLVYMLHFYTSTSV